MKKTIILHTTQFSKTQKRIIQLTNQGLSGVEIAMKLNRSVDTIKTHFRIIYNKSGVNDKTALIIGLYQAGYFGCVCEED